jgi:hypothetical protein
MNEPVSNLPDHPDDPQLPPALAERLERMRGRSIAIPPELDRAILGQARRHASRRRLFRLAARWGGAAAAAAAIVLLAIQIIAPPAPTPSIALQPAGPTMLDAYRLARLVDSGQPVDLQHDYNRDGRVDQADVDMLARAVVRLDGGVR